MHKCWILSAATGAPGLTEEAWLRLIASDDRLTPHPPQAGVPNPFKPGELMTVEPDPRSVAVEARQSRQVVHS